jgi:hypothetical protein
MKLRILLLFSICTLSMQSQWLWDFGVNAAAANYLGDIGGGAGTRRGFVSDLKLAKTRWNFGGFVRYKWRPKLSSNPGRRFRNFNFRNDVYDVGFTGEYFFYENNDLGNTYRYRNGFRAYVFAGVGGFFSNPKTLYQGEWVALQPLATEGVQYRKFVMNIPMGVGFYFTLNKKNRIGFEINYRKTFTDYLDDISGNYPDKPSDSYSQGLILRTTELNSTDPQLVASNPGAYESHQFGGYKRGDSKHKDAYLTMGLSYSYVIRGKSSFYRVRNTGFFSKKRKMRKIRAKF